MQTLEGAKQFAGKSHVKASTVVPDKEDATFRIVLCTDFNISICLLGGKLPGIVDQVLKHDPEQFRISLGCQICGNQEADLSFGLCSFEGIGDMLSHGAQVDELGLHGCACDTRKGKQIID